MKREKVVNRKMQKKSFMKPLLFSMMAFVVILGLLAAATAGGPQKKAAKAKPASQPATKKTTPVRLGSVYTPVSLATDEAAVAADGQHEQPTLTPTFGDSTVDLLRTNSRPPTYKVVGLTKTTTAAPAVTYYLQVYLVTFVAGEHRLVLTAKTTKEYRQAWQYYDANNTLKPWPQKNNDPDLNGVPIPVDDQGNTKPIKLKFVGGTFSPKDNYMFVVHSGTPELGDLFASTTIRIKQ